MARFTTESIRRHRAPQDRLTLSDGVARGLYLVIEPSGTKRFLLRYKVDGKTYRHALGTFGEAGEPGRVTLDQARALAHDWRERIRRGEYPHDVIAREREVHALERKARSEAPTVTDLADLFLEKHLRPNTRHPEHRLLQFKKHVIPELGTVKLTDIRRKHLNAVLDGLVAEGGDKVAYSLARILGQMFRFAVDEELIETSPAERLRKGKPHTPGSRILTDDELRTVWKALEGGELPMSAPVRLGLRILLLTGARSGELAAARWDDVRLEGDMPQWTIPTDKMGSGHLIPLGKTSVELFTQLHTLTGDTDFVLPAAERVMGLARMKARKREVTEHMDSHAIATALRRCHDAGKFLDVAAFGAHDLRRTMRTGLVKLGTTTELAERVIGHKPRSVLLVTYDLYDRLPERRKALVEWDAEVQRILAGKSKVTAIHTKRARR